MLSNHIYNLILQLGEESKSLSRITECYVKEDADCEECKTFWEKMIMDKEDHIRELRDLLKKHL